MKFCVVDWFAVMTLKDYAVQNVSLPKLLFQLS